MFVQSPYYRDPSILAAIKEGEISKVERYLQSGGWVDMPFTKNGNSLLSIAAKYGQKEIVRFLVENGAHQYNNNKNESVLSRAVGEVKYYLESVYEASSSTLPVLIRAQIEKFQSVVEVIEFIQRLPKEHQSVVEAYCAERTFTHPWEALQILEYTGQRIKNIVAGVLVKTACSCADLKLAMHSIEKMEGDTLFKKELEKDVGRARDRLKKIEANLQTNGFCKSLAEGFKLLNAKGQLLPTEIDYLLTNMSKTQTFEGALEFANSILDPSLRGFARRGLSYIDRDLMERICNEEGWEEFDAVDQETWAANLFYMTHLDTEESDEGFDRSLESLELKKCLPFYHEFRMRLCEEMFESKRYEKAYQVAKEEHEKETFTEQSKKVIKNILAICNKEGLDEWKELFNKLL